MAGKANVSVIKKFFFPLWLVPSQGPADVQLSNTSSTSLKAVWGRVLQCCRHGIIRGYRLFLKDNSSTAIVSNGTVTAGQYEFEFPSLLKYYAYSVTVLAFTVKGDGALSKDVVTMTDEDGKASYLLQSFFLSVHLFSWSLSKRKTEKTDHLKWLSPVHLDT